MFERELMATACQVGLNDDAMSGVSATSYQKPARDPRLTHLRAERDRRGHTSCRSGTGAMLTHNGMTLSISEWTEITGLGNATIRKRLKVGMTHTKALSVESYGGKSIPERIDEIRA